MADPSPAAAAATLRRIVELAVAPGRPSQGRVPWAYLIAGPPGAGKSRLAEEALADCRATEGTPVHVDGDKLRAYHPDYTARARTDPTGAFALSQPFASRWADGLRDAAIDKRLDIVIEGVFKTEVNTVALLERLRVAGYEVRLLVKVIPAAMSLLHIERRYERQMSGGHSREAAPRRVDAAAHDVGYRAVQPLLELFDRRGLAAGVSARDMDNAPIPVSGGPAGSWSATVVDLRSRPPANREQIYCNAALREIQRMRLTRGVPEEPEFGSALDIAIALMADW